MTSNGKSPSSEGYSIGQVAEQTGIAADTLRIWERRYGRPVPDRRPSGHRRYSAEQVRWLRRVAEALATGHRPSTVVPLDDPSLDAVLESSTKAPDDDADVTRWLELVRQGRDRKLASSLRQAMAAADTCKFLDEKLGAFLTRVGREWADGHLAIRQEHATSEIVEDVLRQGRRSVAPEDNGGASLRPILLATLPGELHGLGLLMAAAVCSSCGVTVRSTGPNLPVAEIVQAARDIDACAVGVSVSLAASGASQERNIAALRRELPAGVELLVGGAGVRSGWGRRRGVTVVADLERLRDWLLRRRADAERR